MTDFVPVNSLEIALRNVLRDRNTPLWSFYTPLAAAKLWIFARHYPELDGSEETAPAGKNPEICIFSAPEKTSYIGVYTAQSRAEEAFAKLNLSRGELTIISAQGYQLFRFLQDFDADQMINLGLPQ